MFSQTPVFDAEKAVAEYHVSGSDPFVLGHYPNDAVFPGVVSLHCMKTLADGYVDYLTENEPGESQLKRTSYLGLIRPGDVLEISCRLVRFDAKKISLKAAISVDGEVKLRSSFVYAIAETQPEDGA